MSESAPRVQRHAKLVGLFVGVPMSAIFLWLAMRGADLGEVWSALGGADLRLVSVGVTAIAVVYFLQAVRWQSVARTSRVPVRRFAEMIVSGIAVNNVLPGRVGDVLRARWLQVAARIPGGRAIATVFVDRAFDVLALVAFIALSLPFVAGAQGLVRIAVGGLVLLVVLALVLVAARVYTKRRDRNRRQRGVVRRVVRDTLEGLADPLGRRRGTALAGVSLLAWAAWALAAWLVARSLGIELSATEAVFVTAVINLGVAIPSSPGFIGTYQWLGVSALSLLDVGTDEALAFAILMHGVWYVPTLLVGGALLLRRSISALRSGSVGRASLGGAGDA